MLADAIDVLGVVLPVVAVVAVFVIFAATKWGRKAMKDSFQAGQRFVGHGDEARSEFITARSNRQWFGICDNAWVKPTMETVVAIRPQMLGK